VDDIGKVRVHVKPTVEALVDEIPTLSKFSAGHLQLYFRM